jgi:hypothetical protein
MMVTLSRLYWFSLNSTVRLMKLKIVLVWNLPDISAKSATKTSTILVTKDRPIYSLLIVVGMSSTLDALINRVRPYLRFQHHFYVQQKHYHLHDLHQLRAYFKPWNDGLLTLQKLKTFVRSGSIL